MKSLPFLVNGYAYCWSDALRIADNSIDSLLRIIDHQDKLQKKVLHREPYAI